MMHANLLYSATMEKAHANIGVLLRDTFFANEGKYRKEDSVYYLLFFSVTV